MLKTNDYKRNSKIVQSGNGAAASGPDPMWFEESSRGAKIEETKGRQANRVRLAAARRCVPHSLLCTHVKNIQMGVIVTLHGALSWHHRGISTPRRNGKGEGYHENIVQKIPFKRRGRKNSVRNNIPCNKA